MDYIIRRALETDIDKIFEMMTALDTETKYMMYEPGERGNDKSDLKRMIDLAVNGENLMIIAEVAGEIVGYMSAERGIPNRIRHSAYVIVGIRKNYRGHGIGKLFFKELHDWAKRVHISRLELTVMCTNDIARRLYEHNGFEIEGVKKKSMLVEDTYVDEYYMAKLL